MGARLVWTKPDGTEVTFPLTASPRLIGRDEGVDICIDEPLVSRAHARLEERPEGWYVIDLGSTNTTKLNGEPITERAVKDGDELRFARAVCRFLL